MVAVALLLEKSYRQLFVSLLHSSMKHVCFFLLLSTKEALPGRMDFPGKEDTGLLYKFANALDDCSVDGHSYMVGRSLVAASS